MKHVLSTPCLIVYKPRQLDQEGQAINNAASATSGKSNNP